MCDLPSPSSEEPRPGDIAPDFGPGKAANRNLCNLRILSLCAFASVLLTPVAQPGLAAHEVTDSHGTKV